MERKYTHHSAWFFGNKVSEYGLQHGYVDYGTLSKSFDAVLNNELIRKFKFVPVNGDYYYYTNNNGDRISEREYLNMEKELKNDYTGCYTEVCQWYIVSKNGYRILSECTDELVYYCSELDLYLWGVAHYGTSWDYVLTDIHIEIEKEEQL